MASDNPKLAATYKTAVMTIFAANSVPPSSERRNKPEHDSWKQHLREYYNSVLPQNSTPGLGRISEGKQIWCPILKKYASPEYRCAAHIVPHFIGYENAAWMFGDEGDMAAGSSNIWNFKNGLVMAKSLEKQFDRGDFVIVPSLPMQNGRPQRLRFVLLNVAYSHHQVGGDTGIHYSTLDGTELEFKGVGRPGLRYLYWHYITSLLRAVKWEKAVWDDLKARFPDGPLWATPGPYLRRSMLRQLAIAFGDYELQEQEFREGTCDGEGQESSIDERAIAADMARRLEVGGSHKECDSDSCCDCD
jgi:HNH endonuclease